MLSKRMGLGSNQVLFASRNPNHHYPSPQTVIDVSGYLTQGWGFTCTPVAEVSQDLVPDLAELPLRAESQQLRVEVPLPPVLQVLRHGLVELLSSLEQQLSCGGQRLLLTHQLEHLGALGSTTGNPLEHMAQVV